MNNELHEIAVETGKLADEVKDATNQIRELVTKVGDTTSHSSGGGRAEVHMHSVGPWVWVAVTCCIVQMVMTAALAFVVFWIAMNDRDKGHQINALYMSVPGLRELVQKQIEADKALRNQTEEPAQ